MNSLYTSIIRTVVPYVIGSIITFFTSKGINIPEDIELQLTILLNTLFASLYYIAARLLERYRSKFGWLLGVPAQPTYKEGK